MISERHANFVESRDGATSDDVRRLLDLARHEVWRKFGVRMELEVRVWE